MWTSLFLYRLDMSAATWTWKKWERWRRSERERERGWETSFCSLFVSVIAAFSWGSSSFCCKTASSSLLIKTSTWVAAFWESFKWWRRLSVSLSRYLEKERLRWSELLVACCHGLVAPLWVADQEEVLCALLTQQSNHLVQVSHHLPHTFLRLVLHWLRKLCLQLHEVLGGQIATV